MKKKQIIFRKKAVVVGIVMLFFFVLLPLNTTAQDISTEMSDPLLSVSMKSNARETSESPLLCPGSGLYLAFPPFLVKRGWAPWYTQVRDWSNKPFPNETLMFIGSGVGFRPQVPVIFILLSFADPAPETVQVYLDGDEYVSLKGISIPPIHPTFTLYAFSCTKKGFHHLKFVPDDNESAALSRDLQVGFRGFTENILPYLRENS